MAILKVDIESECAMVTCVIIEVQYKFLPRVVGPYTLSNLCQRLKSSLPLY